MPQLATAETIVGKHEKFLLYGLPKTGKTLAALTAPSPVYCVLLGGANEIKCMFSKHFREKYPDQEIYFDVATEEYDEHGRFKEAKAFDIACDQLSAALAKDADPDDPLSFETVVVDSATQLIDFQMNKSIEVSRSIVMGGSGNIEKTAIARYETEGILIPGDNDYLGAQSLNRKFMSWLFRLNKHVVVVCHEWQKTATDRRTKKDTLLAMRPLFYGKDRTDIPAVFDNVWRFRKDGQFYEAYTESDGDRFIAGTRMGGVIDPIYRNVNLTDAITQLQEAAAQK